MPTPAPAPAVYSIVSWVRRGLASLVAGQPATNYASLPVSITVNGAAVSAPAIRLLSPGDITGLDARAVIRTDPRNLADAFEPNYLAMVELVLPDLPWMFTPSGDANGRLQPWLCLIAVPDGPGASLQGRAGGASVLRIEAPLDPKVELPDLKTIDLWAHAQVTSEALSGSALNAAFNGNPSGTLARLVASRRLDPNRSYIACIVPTYHAGVNAALGIAVDEHDLAPAWDASVTAPFVLPVYYYFRFSTGPGGDFASLAKKITPVAGSVVAGTRTMDVSQPEFGMAPVHTETATNPVPVVTMELEGALRTFDSQSNGTSIPAPPTDAQTAYANALRRSLTPPAPAPGTDPVLPPPTYGSTAAALPLPLSGKPPFWLSDVNLDPRTRVAASAGTQVIQKNQEALVASSWDQIGEMQKANRLLRQAQLARQVASSLSSRHLQTVNGDGVFLQMTAPMHSRVTLTTPNTTLLGSIESSRLPSGAVSAAMRKMTRPRGPLGRQVKNGTTQIVERLNLPANSAANALQVAGPVLPPRGMVALDAVAVKTPGAPSGVGIQVGKMGPPPTGAGFNIKDIGKAVQAVVPVEPGKVLPGLPTIPVGPALPVKPPPLVDWNTNPNLPLILKVARPGLPAPIVFPSTQSELVTMQHEFRSACTAVNGYLQVTPAVTTDPPPLGGTGTAPLTAVRSQLLARIDPEITIKARLGSRIQLGTGIDPLQPMQSGPAFPEPPMYTALAELSPEWMLPGFSAIPMDCATLLAPNAPFIESFLVGLNEELARELLWRQFPADPQATYFQNFWGSGTSDIPQIRTFDANGHIGDHVTGQAGGSNSIVLLIRANLFRRYPNAVVSAVQAQWTNDPHGTGKIRILTDTRNYPTFRGEIGSDVTFFGFNVPDPRGSDDPAAGRPGWYFVIEEHLTEPRFGLEPNKPPAPEAPPVWNDFSWLDLPAGDFPNPALTVPPRENVTWGKDAASMAFILLRRPVRIAMHALALLGPQDSGTVRP